MPLLDRFSIWRCFFPFILIGFLFVAVSCKTASNLSLEDAQRISAGGEHGFTPPPRAGVAAELAPPGYLASFDREACNDEPPEPVDIDRLIEDSQYWCNKGRWSSEPHECLSYKLFVKGREAMNRGQYLEAIEIIKAALGKSHLGQPKYYRPHLAASYAAIGDFSAAYRYMSGGTTIHTRSHSGRYQAMVNYALGRASLACVRGNYPEAEKYYRKAQKLCEQAKSELAQVQFYDTQTQLMPDLGEVILMQGRPVEAELLLRESLNRVSYTGGAPNARLRTLVMLGRLFHQQGRYADAEVLTRAAIGGYRAYGFNCWQLDLNLAHHGLAKALLAQGRPAEALEQFKIIQDNLRYTPRIFKLRFEDDPDWAYALLANKEYSRAEKKLTNALKTAGSQYGASHHRTAEIRGLLAAAQYRQKNSNAAEKNFNSAVPLLLKHSRASGDEAGAQVAFNRRLKVIVETYMVLIAANQKDMNAAAEKTFLLADAIRGHAVQQAVAASSTRIAAKDRRLADLVRQEQDAVLLNSEAQTDGGGKRKKALEKEISQLRQARDVILAEIEADFPAYAELTRPRPKKLSAVQATLQQDEALLSFYSGNETIFVWSLSGRGRIEFAAIPIGEKAIAGDVQNIRDSVTPQGASLDALPPFDIATAHQLYQTLLEPVRASWKQAEHLIIVPDGPLGHLPFALLPASNKSLKTIKKLPLSEYREVPWLVRDYSLTVLPSPGSQITLRSLPETDPKRRALAGFGDPVFSKEQALVASAGQSAPGSPAISTRAIRVTKEASLDESQLTSATLEMLQPLPDTREEVLAIARALNADMVHDVFLGQSASEMAVKNTDLSNRRVLVFATHGLVPGDLDGLLQPALALSSPTVTGDADNDGILTMGEIMGLRLNADWVVLSACNTAAGQGAGSEAVSGLGQAFFYAGTRALLVSNWPVESASAKLLTTELFRQQEADPTLSRAVALQKSMLKLLDTGTYRDPNTNQAVYAYAHSMFWAPFSMVGEGSR